MTTNNGKDMTKSMSPQPSKRGEVAPFLVMDVFAAAVRREREGHSVVHMEVGQPGAGVGVHHDLVAALGRATSSQAGARYRQDRLYRSFGHAVLAREDRQTLPRNLWRNGIR